MVKLILKNFLVQYKGGGYDGCFWEWNFFYFDSKGEFHNLMSTGHSGIKTKAEAVEILTKKDTSSWGGKEHYTYNLKSTAKLKEFEKETSESLVASIVGKVNEIEKKPVMYWKCDGCLDKQHDSNMFHDGNTGNGGIGVTMKGKLCQDCYSIDSCCYCGEYENGLSETFTEDGHCKYCKKEEKETA